ncbi:GNAT family N-acetyltransferase [Duganella sp. P38]|jgi:RimJ/RimL family protein N-acetyltransferase|uniref:GNAT family N-acetyltransferase n=1 Tax=Duganella sp. P38 TaxID=3423949 RepID=UPI003D7A387B
MSAPRYVKPKAVRGNKLVFRDATVDDAEFILSLRTDASKNRYLSATSSDVQQQRDWLARYAADDNQIYFIICALDGRPVGTVRLYDQQGDSFCWGSWIKSDDAPGGFGIESALIIYAYALQLGFQRAHFQVSKGNDGVISFHQRFGAVETAENDVEFHYEMSNAAIHGALAQYRKFLPDGIQVEF